MCVCLSCSANFQPLKQITLAANGQLRISVSANTHADSVIIISAYSDVVRGNIGRD